MNGQIEEFIATLDTPLTDSGFLAIIVVLALALLENIWRPLFLYFSSQNFCDLFVRTITDLVHEFFNGKSSSNMSESEHHVLRVRQICI